MATKTLITKKQNKVIVLPELREYIIQPNRITNAISDYTLYQERIFTAIVYHLQEPIRKSFNGENYKQLDLFSHDMVYVDIPLRDISKPREYGKVKDAIRDMSTTRISIRYKDAKGVNKEQVGGLFIADMPDKSDWRGTIRIKIDPLVADLIVRIDKNSFGKGIQYTRFSYQIAQGVKSKFGAKLYKLISSWKAKGGFYISKEDLYELLGVTGKYERYSDFKRRVLLPVHEELFEKADCWFNCKAKDFEARKGNEVVGFNFKVITPEFLETNNKKVEQIIHLLTTHFNCNETDIAEIAHLLEPDVFNFSLMMNKISDLGEKVNHSIKQKNRYVITSILNEFGNNS